MFFILAVTIIISCLIAFVIIYMFELSWIKTPGHIYKRISFNQFIKWYSKDKRNWDLESHSPVYSHQYRYVYLYFNIIDFCKYRIFRRKIIKDSVKNLHNEYYIKIKKYYEDMEQDNGIRKHDN